MAKETNKPTEKFRSIGPALATWLAGFTGVFILTTVLTVFNYLLSNIIRSLSLEGRDIAYLGILFTIFLVTSAVVSAFLIRRFNHLKVIAGGGLLAAAGCLYCGWVITTDPAQMALGVVLFAAGIAAALTGLLSWLAQVLKPLALSGMSAAAFLLADRLAAPGGAGILFSLANTQNLNVLYSICGMVALLGTALASAMLWMLDRKRQPGIAPKPENGGGAWWVLYALLALVIASSSALSNNLLESFFLRGKVSWETLQVIFATPIPALTYLAVILIAGAGSDLADQLGVRARLGVSGRLIWLLVVLGASGFLLFALAGTVDLGVLISGLRWYAPLDAAVLTALLGYIFSRVSTGRTALAAGLYIALPPLFVAAFGFLESLVIPPTDYLSPLTFSRGYYLAGAVLALALLAADARGRRTAHMHMEEPPTGPR